MAKMNIQDDPLVGIARAILEGTAHKFGDMVTASSINATDLRYETQKIDHKYGNFAEYIDPTEGAGGGTDGMFIDKQWEKFYKANDLRFTIFSYMLDLFTPKSKTLLAFSKRMIEWPSYQNNSEKYKLIDEVKETYTHVGVVRTTEKYRLIVDEATYKALPEDTIGNTSYDYSFHAGEGTIDSFLMAIGNSESDVKTKLKKALGKVKAEYIGNAMELKYAQKRAVGR
jgi:hypothetical protein